MRIDRSVIFFCGAVLLVPFYINDYVRVPTDRHRIIGAAREKEIVLKTNTTKDAVTSAAGRKAKSSAPASPVATEDVAGTADTGGAKDEGFSAAVRAPGSGASTHPTG
jgi:hypothetical protein